MRNIVIIAAKEIQEGLRNRWVLATTLLLAALALSLTFLGSAPTGNVGAGALDVVVVSLSSLTIFLLPLIALLISHDAVVGEMERGTMILLLSYPVGRYQVILGKFCGHVLILAFATVIGYGAAAAALAITGASVLAASWYAFASMLGTSILLGAVFVAIGYLISSLVRDRGTAAGLSVGIWLLMVLVFDMALLGILVVDQGRIVSAPVLEALLFLNPTDLYRLTNLTGFNVSQFSGMAGLAGTASTGIGALLLGPAGLDRRAAWACDRILCAEGIMTLRIVCALVAAIFLAGCNQDAANSVVPPPVALNSDAMGVFCGMNLLEHPGTEGPDHHREQDRPVLVHLGARHRGVHADARPAPRHPGDLRLGYGAGDELGRSGRDQLDRRAQGVLRDRKPQAGRNGRGRGCAVRQSRRRRRFCRGQWRQGRHVRGNSERLCAGQRRCRRPDQNDRPDVRLN